MSETGQTTASYGGKLPASVDEKSVSCLMFRVTVPSNRFMVHRQDGAPVGSRQQRPDLLPVGAGADP